MAKGDVSPGESLISQNPETGVRIRQVTSYHFIHHHPFFYIPA